MTTTTTTTTVGIFWMVVVLVMVAAAAASSSSSAAAAAFHDVDAAQFRPMMMMTLQQQQQKTTQPRLSSSFAAAAAATKATSPPPTTTTRRIPFLLVVNTIRGGSRLEDETVVVDDDDDDDDDDHCDNTSRKKQSEDDDEPIVGFSKATESSENSSSNIGSSNSSASETTAAANVNDHDADQIEEDLSSLKEDTDVAIKMNDQPMVAPAVVETTTTTVLHHDDDDESSSSSSSVAASLKETVDQNDLQQQQQHDKVSKDKTVDDTTRKITTVEPLTPEQIQTAIEQASKLRTVGKELHDKGDFAQAATQFAAAADHLFRVLLVQKSVAAADDDVVDIDDDVDIDSVTDDFATCRLHAALCFLKAGNYEETIKACTDVLDLPADKASSSSSSSSSSLSSASIEPALRARAFHRRAKAQVELGNEEAALEDARAAAFLGDRRAVALYGRLMRESSTFASLNGVGGDNGDSLAASSALFESLLSKSKSGSGPSLNPDSLGDIGNIFPSSLFDMIGAGAAAGGGENGAGSLAKSVLSSLSKRLHEESTQDQICTYLQSTSGPQIQQMASLAGIQLPEAQANRLASFCNGVTPKTIQKTLRTTKVAYFIFKMVRKMSQLISKYRSIIILIILVGWIKSAILRPLPVNKKAARIAAKQAAKAAAAAATVTEAM